MCYTKLKMRNGFTLIEAVMTLLIIGILAAIAFPAMGPSLITLRLEAARQKLKSDIIYTQALSVTQQVNHGVIFNPGSNTYSVYRQTTSNVVNNPLTGKPFTVSYSTDTDFKGVSVISTSFGSPSTDRVEFDNFGAPSDGTTALSADGTVTLSAGGTGATVTVTKNTGKAS